MKLHLVRVSRRICVPCTYGSHECCEPIPVRENGFMQPEDGTAYVECSCLCNPEWMQQKHDSERRAG